MKRHLTEITCSCVFYKKIIHKKHFSGEVVECNFYVIGQYKKKKHQFTLQQINNNNKVFYEFALCKMGDCVRGWA